MKNARRLIQCAVVAALAALLPSGPLTAAEVTLRCGHDQPENYFYNAIWTKFKELVESRTKGRVEVKIFPNAQFGDESQLVENLRIGTVDCAGASVGQISAHIPQPALLGVPYIVENTKHRELIVAPEGKTFQYLSKVVRDTGEFRLLGFHTAGVRSVFNKVRPIRTPEDMKGLKIRTMTDPVQVESFKALGALPTPLPYAEVYTGMQAGVVDGAEGSNASIWTQKFYEVSKYYSRTQHMVAIGLEFLSEKAYQKLPADLRPIVMQAGQEASAHGRAFDDRIQEEYLVKIKEKGVQINELDTAPFVERTRHLHEKIAKDLKAEELLAIIKEEAKKARGS